MRIIRGNMNILAFRGQKSGCVLYAGAYYTRKITVLDPKVVECLIGLLSYIFFNQEQIECDQDRKGNTKATWTLLDRLRRRENWFEVHTLFSISLGENPL